MPRAHHALAALLTTAATLLLFTLAACQFHTGQTNPETALQLWAQAEQFYQTRDYAAAADTMDRARSSDPDNLHLQQRYAEFLEMNADPAGAAAVYRETLQRVAPHDPLRLDLIYQMALLQALKLRQVDGSSQSLAQLPTTDPRHGVLAAAQALAGDDARGALQHLNALRSQPLEQPMAARVAYVAALAYLKLGEREQAVGALYRAINLAGKTLVAFDIEQLWRRLKDDAAH